MAKGDINFGSNMLDYSEKVISTNPVIIKRGVRFGECDPAGVVYTPVFSEYVISAYQWLMSTLLGGPILHELRRLGIDSPIKALSLEFRSMLEPEQVFDMTCRVGGIRNRTFQVDVFGCTLADKPRDIFVGHLTPIIIARGERRAIEIPKALYSRLQDYRARNESAFADRS